MFENIGEKIKILAKCMTWIGIICSVIIKQLQPEDTLQLVLEAESK